MIADFADSWLLFHDAYLSGWLIGILLSLMGVLIVARDQVFIGAAISQASLLGIAVGIALGSATPGPSSWWHSEMFHSMMGGVFAVLAAFLTTHARLRTYKETHEAITGWVFIGSGSSAILLLAHSPHGLEEVTKLLSSTIIGAREFDVWVFGIMTLLTIIFLTYNYRAVLLLVLDFEMAQAVGMRTALWNSLLSVWLGLAIGFAIHVAGVIFAFAHLVLPPLIAKHIGATARSLFIIAPCVSVLSNVCAFLLANHYDYPLGQMAAAILSLVLALTWSFRSVRVR